MTLKPAFCHILPAQREGRKNLATARRMVGGSLATVLLILQVACSSISPPRQDVRSAVVHALAPSGTLRVAINFGNPILATRHEAGGFGGASVDIARELAQRLGVPLQLLPFEAAGKVVEALKQAQVDLVFVAIDPVRGNDILYTAPYVIIEGCYLVRQDSSIYSNAQVDRIGNRIVVGAGSAYDLYLSRELKNAKLVRVPRSPEVTDTFVAHDFEVAAGVKQQLQADARRWPDLRLLEGRFMVIQQALGIPRSAAPGLPFLRQFIENLKASGFVAQALRRHHIEGAGVAPASNLN